MPTTLALQFPAGRYAAAAWDDRDELEWPPHPARLCLGLLDALYRAGHPPAERAALDWLCAQGAPEIVVPREEDITRQIQDGFFVPQNPSVANGTQHPRKNRTFPVVYLDGDQPTVFFHWPAAEIPPDLQPALASLVGRLPRLGHSSSLCVVSLLAEPPSRENQCWLHPTEKPAEEPDLDRAEHTVRIPWEGLLRSAEEAFDAAGREQERIDLVEEAGKKAKPNKPLKPAASARGRHDPRHLWAAYATRREDLKHTPWDDRLLILRMVKPAGETTLAAGARPGLVSTWQITEILHKTLLSKWGRHEAELGPVPAWISGHAARPAEGASGAPLREGAHLAVFPLAHVGSTHADGHLLGLAIAPPRPESAHGDAMAFRREWQQALRVWLEENGQLSLHAADQSWALCLEPYGEEDAGRGSAQTLKAGRWTGPSRRWRSVTPVILDRHPKPHFQKDPEAWLESCRAIVRGSCERQGLEPTRIEPMLVSTMPGVPHAAAFPTPRPRPGRPPRFHVHAEIRFERPVVGPLLLGAGRHRGYGLMLPLPEQGGETA